MNVCPPPRFSALALSHSSERKCLSAASRNDRNLPFCGPTFSRKFPGADGQRTPGSNPERHAGCGLRAAGKRRGDTSKCGTTSPARRPLRTGRHASPPTPHSSASSQTIWACPMWNLRPSRTWPHHISSTSSGDEINERAGGADNHVLRSAPTRAGSGVARADRSPRFRLRFPVTVPRWGFCRDERLDAHARR